MQNKSARLFRSWPFLALAGAIGILAYFAFYVILRIGPGRHLGDFPHFFTAAQAMRNHQNIYEVMAPGYDRAGYIYPPLVAFLYTPLAACFDMVTAARVILVVNLSFLMLGLWVGARAMLERFGEDLKAPGAWQAVIAVVLGTLLLTFDKSKGELQMLQTNAMIFAALLVALWFLDRKPIWAGAALGFAMNIKYQALAIFFYLLLRRRWKAAGWMLVWTVFWGLLPGLLVGFGQESSYLVMSFGGILRLVGIHTGPQLVADVEGIASGFSLSIPSALARGLNFSGSTWNPMVVALPIGLAWLASVMFCYGRRSVPWICWPRAADQDSEPWRRWVAIEWMILIATTLCFSPQTNSRHMVLTGIINMGSLSLLICGRRDGLRWSVIVGLVVLWMGLNLPPGNRHQMLETESVEFWHTIGGPCWTMLVASWLIAWGGFDRVPTWRALRLDLESSPALALSGANPYGEQLVIEKSIS